MKTYFIALTFLVGLSSFSSQAVASGGHHGHHRDRYQGHHNHYNDRVYARPRFRDRAFYTVQPQVFYAPPPPPVYYQPAPPPPVYYHPAQQQPRNYDQRSGQGLAGGVIGGVLGYQMGNGSPVATGLGAAAGSFVGNRW